MKMEKLKPTLVLVSICLVVALLLSSLNLITGPEIEKNKNALSNSALFEVLPDGKNFEEITDLTSYPKVIDKAYKADGGFVFRATVSGKNPGLIVMCGVSTDGKIVGTKVIDDKETDDYDKNVFPSVEGVDGKYKGMTLEGFTPYLVADATLTSSAYGEAVKACLQAYAIASGGNVDLRTPEEIFQDDCNALFGTEGKKFERWFATEVLDGINAVYESEGVGRVFVIGESLVGVKADGTVANTDISEENKALATIANATVTASTLSEITDIPEGISKKTVTKIFVTESGNYVFELSAKGYQALTEWGSGDYIKIKLSISADGKIIDCLTISQKESKGYGDVCASEEYTSQYRGRENDEIKISSSEPDSHAPGDLIPTGTTDIGAIASATFTTYGYQKAVKAAFSAFELLTNQGGDN